MEAYAYYYSDEVLAVYMPVVVYWITSGIYELLVYLRPDARLHTKEEEEAKNIPSRWKVARIALSLQAVQMLSTILFVKFTDRGIPMPQPSFPMLLLQLFLTTVIFDGIQYFTHRLMHTNKYWYKHFHSVHHGLLVCYPFGGIYGSALDGFLVDTFGTILAMALTKLTPRTSMYFIAIANIKTVDIHCGLWLPWNPINWFCGSTSAFHDSHHQLKGHNYNFSQPFFVAWDKIFGTYMPYTIEKRKEGGYEVRIMKEE